ncbi:XIAP [Mytilus coruscus]|uniref:XIAP n=1 Tax=Mytilus coruscus TaxID=42192 RepID=A0A6J8CJM5_MYTCO|nr:XIAP [Mytilus coruscus]
MENQKKFRKPALHILYCETCETRTSYLEWIGEKTPTEAHCNLSPNCELAKKIHKITTGWSNYTVCFCCGLWVAELEKDEDPWIVHAKYCPGCLFLKKSKGLEYIRDVQKEWRKIYKPLKPDIEDEAHRIKTFKLSDEYNGSKKAETLAKAGFFLECIAGEKLKVVCHYCNCNIESWINECDPWVVHVKRMTEYKLYAFDTLCGDESERSNLQVGSGQFDDANINAAESSFSDESVTIDPSVDMTSVEVLIYWVRTGTLRVHISIEGDHLNAVTDTGAEVTSMKKFVKITENRRQSIYRAERNLVVAEAGK